MDWIPCPPPYVVPEGCISTFRRAPEWVPALPLTKLPKDWPPPWDIPWQPTDWSRVVEGVRTAVSVALNRKAVVTTIEDTVLKGIDRVVLHEGSNRVRETWMVGSGVDVVIVHMIGVTSY